MGILLRLFSLLQEVRECDKAANQEKQNANFERVPAQRAEEVQLHDD